MARQYIKRAKRGDTKIWLDAAINHVGDRCLEWPFAKYQDGYGTFTAKSKRHAAHRFVCAAVHGEPPTLKHEAAHSCGNRACCNPLHLRWATRKENMADKYLHGTMCRGEDTHGAKLNAEKVLAIRADSRSAAKIAAEYGVSANHAWMIKKGKKWSWLDNGVSG